MALNPTQLRVIAAALNADLGAEGGVPVLIWGDPGIGKTALVGHMFTGSGYDVQTIVGSCREPSDFAGIPFRGDDGTTYLAPPQWAARANAAPKALVVLDELSSSTPAVMAAQMRVVNERYAGDFKIGPDVRFIACANDPEIAANGFDLPAPLSNRFLHIDASPSLEDWSMGMTAGWDSVTPDIGDLVRVTPDASRKASKRSVVATFLKRFPTLFSCCPTDPSSQGRPWPSPRTWDMLSAVLAHLADDDENAILVAANGLVGAGAGAQFTAWVRENDLPDPETVLADPGSYDWADPRLDRTFAVLSGVAAVVAARCTQARWDQAWRSVAAAADARKTDVAVICVKALVGCRPKNASIPAGVAMKFTNLLAQMGHLTKDAA